MNLIVSFIIPVYNVDEAMLQSCLDSIAALSLQEGEREIIVVDDGSALPLSIDLKGAYYVRQPHAGVSAARNTALRLAQGEYVQFIDGDDALIGPPYEHVLDFVRYRRPDAVLFDFSTEPTAPTTFDDQEPLTGIELMRTQNLHGSSWGYIFRRQMAGSLTFSTDLAFGEDEEFTARLLLRAESVIRTSAQAYFYRQHAASAVHTADHATTQQRLDNSLTLLCRLQSLAATLPQPERVALSRRVAQLTMDYLYKIIMETRSRDELESRIEGLRQQGLFPLPNRDYTQKYTWFRRMINTPVGRALLLRTLPLMKRER